MSVSTQTRKAMKICGFCNDGNHKHCCRTIRNGVKGLWHCHCEEPGCGGMNVLTCVDCRKVYKNTDDIDVQTHQCVDRNACYARIEAKRTASGSQFHHIGDIIKESRMAQAEAKAEQREKTTKVKEADCTCGCGGKTKGGKFLPGHDARFVSQQVERVLNKSKTEVAARKEVAAASDTLAAKFDKSLGLAKDRAQKAADAKAEKAKAKADKEAAAKAAKETAKA